MKYEERIWTYEYQCLNDKLLCYLLPTVPQKDFSDSRGGISVQRISRKICERNNFELIALECDKDHGHLFVNTPPTFSATDVVRIVKTNTAKVLLREFKEFSLTQNLWTRNYFASMAGNVCSETIKKYVESQKKKS